MNILANLEAVFTATVALAASSMFITDPAPLASTQPVVRSDSPTIAVIVVSARRMNAEEKLKSVQVESEHANERS
ncbi:MAG: hypothetical protein V4723_05895 [Pseudomonadota bacterium]